MRLAAFWLIGNAGLLLLLLAIVLLGGLGDPDGLTTAILSHPITFILNVLFIVGMLISGLLLYQRSILGGYGGLAVYGLGLVASLASGSPSVLGIFVGALGLFAILSAWDDLDTVESEFSAVAGIRASPASVWQVMRDVAQWPSWTTSISEVSVLDDEPLGVGSRVAIRQPGLPSATWEVTELEPEKGFTWVSRSPGVEVTARHQIEPTEAGSRVTLSVTYAGALGPLIGWLFRNKTDNYLLLEAHGLKRRTESDTSAGDIAH